MTDPFHDPRVAPAPERGDLGILEEIGARTGARRRTHTGFAIRGVDRAYVAREVTSAERAVALEALAMAHGEDTPRGGRTFHLEPVA
ncbi:MAG: hypothetical protein MUE82_11510 [Chloroflexi bacterium]|jgi:hypothetical protein|nr:hypothetical protein [Chloroflexota bacterium]